MSSGESWREAKDPASGRTYYINNRTNETSWTKPEPPATINNPAPVAPTAPVAATKSPVLAPKVIHSASSTSTTATPTNAAPSSSSSGGAEDSSDEEPTQASAAETTGGGAGGGGARAGGPPAVRKGYLHKKGNVVKNWKTRYFILTRESMSYWETGACLKKKGVIMFTEKTRIDDATGDGHKFAFRFDVTAEVLQVGGIKGGSDSTLRTYHFACDTDEERHEWVKAIKKVVEDRIAYLTAP